MGAVATLEGRRLRLIVAIAAGASCLLIGAVQLFRFGSSLAIFAAPGLATSFVLPIAVLWGSPRLITFGQLVSGVLASLSLGGFALSTGGAHGAAELAFLATPLVFGLVCLETPLAPLVCGVSVALIGDFVWWLDGRAGPELVALSLGGPAAGLMAMYGNHLYRRTLKAELQVERERRQLAEDRALMQRKGAEAERLATLGRLAAGVAHEINNPLAFVTSNVSFLVRTLERCELGTGRPEIDDALAETQEGLEHIRSVVGDLSSLSRSPAPGERTCDASASLEAALRIAAVKAQGIARFEVEAPPVFAPLPMNGGRLVQVLVNLLLNAVDAIEADPRRLGHGTVWVQLTPERLVISDDGPGIAPEVRPHLFEPFFSTKPGKGTGLGLALCRQYLSECGFSITADGRPGGGARFTVVFA